MYLQDDRTPEQRTKPHLIVLMTDRVLSGWGEARGGPSYAAWACSPDKLTQTIDKIQRRSDSLRVRVALSTYRPPSGPGHCHIYSNAEDW